MGGSDHKRFATLMKQVAELQRKMDFLMQHLNLDYQDKAPDPEAALCPQLEELIRGEGDQRDQAVSNRDGYRSARGERGD